MIIDKKLLYKEYWINNKSIKQIGKEYNLKSPKYIFKKLNIPKRSISEATKLAMVNPEIREKISKAKKGIIPKSCFKKGMTPWNKDTKGIMKAWNKNISCSEETKKRISESKKGQKPWNFGLKNYKSGEDNCNWKGGITDLYTLLRKTNEYKTWRNEVYKRDDYTCQDCGDNSGGNLEAHHIKLFSVIFQEFLNLYSQFSPIEDKETLVRLAITYEPFWNVDNGKTLCEECHNKTKLGRKSGGK